MDFFKEISGNFASLVEKLFWFFFTFVVLFWLIPLYVVRNPEWLNIVPTLQIPDSVRDLVLILGMLFVTALLLRASKNLQRLYKIRRSNKYIFDPGKWPKEWAISGRPVLKNDVLHVQYSRAGMLLKDYLWKNFILQFEMQFTTMHCKHHMGVIFRAQDHDNYFMLEIRDKDKKVSFAPHIRYKAGMQSTHEDRLQHNFNIDGRFTKITMIVHGEKLELRVNNALCPDFEWILPTHVDVHDREAGVLPGTTPYKQTIFDQLTATHVQPITFREEAGMIGFRAFYYNGNDQGAVIRNITIAKLP